jgi:hypothetical protein
MKKSIFAVVAIVLLTGCGANSTGLLGGVNGTNALGNILGSVLGINKVSEATLVGTWKYSSPGCAFTSQSVLAQAGGEVASQKVKAKLQQQYNSMGINSSNTSFTFNGDKTFTAMLGGKSINGNYQLDPETGKIALNTLLLSLNGYVNLNTTGMSLLFESQKLLSVMQMLGAASGNTTLAVLSELSKNYDGIRLGFDLVR